MFRRLFFLLVVAGIGWYCYNSGIFYNLTHDMSPEVGRACEVVGPIKEGVYFSPKKDHMQWVIDSKIGTATEKANGRIRLARMVDNNELAVLGEHTPVAIVANDKLKVLGFSYPLTKVKVTSGEWTDTVGWVQRDDVIDTPLQQVYQSMRGVASKSDKGSLGE